MELTTAQTNEEKMAGAQELMDKVREANEKLNEYCIKNNIIIKNV